jgi:hypothetical protein
MLGVADSQSIRSPNVENLPHYSTAAMQQLMDSHNATNLSANGTVTISGLTNGQQYRVQMTHHPLPGVEAAGVVLDQRDHVPTAAPLVPVLSEPK